MSKDKAGRFEHPLAINDETPKLDLGQPREPRVHFGGMAQPDQKWNLPTTPGEHSWIAHVGFRVPGNALALGGLAINPHFITMLHVFCWVCERDFENPEMAEGPCLGDPQGRYVPTADEYASWDEAKQDQWSAQFRSDG